MTVYATAFAAVAVYHVAQCSSHLISHSTTKTTPGSIGTIITFFGISSPFIILAAFSALPMVTTQNAIAAARNT
jgi:hypothetical protein